MRSLIQYTLLCLTGTSYIPSLFPMHFPRVSFPICFPGISQVYPSIIPSFISPCVPIISPCVFFPMCSPDISHCMSILYSLAYLPVYSPCVPHAFPVRFLLCVLLYPQPRAFTPGRITGRSLCFLSFPSHSSVTIELLYRSYFLVLG